MYLRRFEKSNWIKFSEVAGLAMDMFARFTTRFRLLSRDGAIRHSSNPTRQVDHHTGAPVLG